MVKRVPVMRGGEYKIPPGERGKVLRDFERALSLGDEQEFMKAMRKIGIQDEDPGFFAGLKTFRALRSGKPEKT
jgi:hypothetical protein